MSKFLRKADVRVGMQVKCKVRKEAYYSGYADRPICFFEPDMIGFVNVVDHCPVKTKNKNGTARAQVLVDFKGPPYRPEFPGENVWRVALRYDNIILL